MTTKEFTTMFIIVISLFLGISFGNGTFSSDTVTITETIQQISVARKIADNKRDITLLEKLPKHCVLDEVVVYPTSIKIVNFSKYNHVKRKIPNVQDDNDDSWKKTTHIEKITNNVYLLDTNAPKAVENIAINLNNISYQDLC